MSRSTESRHKEVTTSSALSRLTDLLLRPEEIDAILTNPKYVFAIGQSRISAMEGIEVMETSKYIEFYGREKNDNNDTHGKYFSNCVPAPIIIDGVEYASSEHYFQISKFATTANDEVFFDNSNIREMHAMTPVEVAKHGRTYRGAPIRKDWDAIRVEVMFRALIEKFKIKEFRNALRASGDLILIERAPTDAYWAINDKGIGKNMLGVLLMIVRSRLE